VLETKELDRPSPSPNELLVSVRAASIILIDAKRRVRGPGVLPKVTESDFAGVIEEVGDKIENFSSRNRVCGTGLHTSRFKQRSFAGTV